MRESSINLPLSLVITMAKRAGMIGDIQDQLKKVVYKGYQQRGQLERAKKAFFENPGAGEFFGMARNQEDIIAQTKYHIEQLDGIEQMIRPLIQEDQTPASISHILRVYDDLINFQRKDYE